MIFIAMLSVTVVTAQHMVFCEIVGTQKFLKMEVNVGIDFGQEEAMRMNFFGGTAARNKLVDDNGKPLTFHSMVDAMNFMGTLGWKFEQAYVVTTGSQNVYHWLLSKIIDDNESIDEGFKIKAQVDANKPKQTEQTDSIKTEQEQTDQPAQAEEQPKKKRKRPGVWPDNID